MDEGTHQAKRLLVGDLILDVGRRRVTRDGKILDCPNQSFRLLHALATAAPDVVAQDELVQQVWPGRVVSPETITQRIKLVRQVLGDDAHEPCYVGLVRGEGYRMLVDVEVLPPEEDGFTRGLVAELGRRRVLQVALLYAAIAWSITEVISFLIEALPVFPNWSKALVAIVFIVGFPVAMFLAWRFDVGPGGIRRTEAISTEGRLTIAAAMLLLIGATAGLFYLIYPRVLEQADLTAGQDQVEIRVTPSPNAIAVLPFVNASANPDDEYISEGLGDELRDQLGRIEGLRVAARSSSVIFRNQELDALAISDRLSVGKLIEGTLRRQGDQLRISVQIIDGFTGFQTWTHSFNRTADDLLTIQQEIANEVVRQILPMLDQSLVASHPATLDRSAHDLMLLARHYYQQVKDNPVVNIELLLKAIDLYTQATIVDPESALAQSRLGDALLYLGDVEAAEGPIFRALSIDPELSEVQYTLGLYYYRRNLPGSGPAHKRAVELNPNNVDALTAYALWIWVQGDTDGAEPYLRRALELDPMSISRYLVIGNFYGMAGQRQKAIALAQQIPSRFNDAPAFLAVSRIYEVVGDLDEAIGWALRARDLRPNDKDATWALAELYARIGDFEAARYFEPEPAMNLLYYERRYEEMIDLAEEKVFNAPNEKQIWYGLARAYTATGEHQQAAYVLQSQGLPENVLSDSRRSNGVEALVNLADALKASGESERANDLAQWLVTFFQKLADEGAPTSWFTNLYLSCSLSILDDDAQSLDVLERIENSPGLAWYPVVRDQPCFQKFVDEPRYQAVVASLENRKAELRERLPDTLARLQTFP